MKRLAFILAIGLACAPVFAAGSRTGTVPVQVTITVSGASELPALGLAPQDFMVFQNGSRRPVTGLEPVTTAESGQDLAILIDGSASGNLSLQFADIKNFMESLPSSTRVAVAYAEYGTAKSGQDFTADKSLAAAALRIPEGQINAGASIYQSLASLVEHWPEDGRARSVLLVSDGLDVNRGVSESLPTLNPDLDDAINRAQRAQVTVYTIYAGGAARFAHEPFLLDNGQSSLARLADATGGRPYFQGTSTPLSFAPFLSELRQALGRQYVLTFEAKLTKANPASLHVTTEVPHLKITAPANVWAGSEK